MFQWGHFYSAGQYRAGLLNLPSQDNSLNRLIILHYTHTQASIFLLKKARNSLPPTSIPHIIMYSTRPFIIPVSILYSAALILWLWRPAHNNYAHVNCDSGTRPPRSCWVSKKKIKYQHIFPTNVNALIPLHCIPSSVFLLTRLTF